MAHTSRPFDIPCVPTVVEALNCEWLAPRKITVPGTCDVISTKLLHTTWHGAPCHEISIAPVTITGITRAASYGCFTPFMELQISLSEADEMALQTIQRRRSEGFDIVWPRPDERRIMVWDPSRIVHVNATLTEVLPTTSTTLLSPDLVVGQRAAIIMSADIRGWDGVLQWCAVRVIVPHAEFSAPLLTTMADAFGAAFGAASPST